MIRTLVLDSPWTRDASPSFAVVCQYLSLLYGIWRLPFSLHARERTMRLAYCMGRNSLKKQLLKMRRLEGINR